MKRGQTKKNKSRYHFRFNNVQVDSELAQRANLKLAQLLAIAPPGATGVGFLEKNEKVYLCAIEVSSPYRTFFEKAAALTPHSAVQRALDKLEDQLYSWRFGSGHNGSSFGTSMQFNQPQLQG